MSTLIDKRIARFKKAPEKSLFLLSLPVIAGMLLHVFYNITDTAFVGRIGVDALAALTFSFPLFFVLIALAGLIGHGAMSLIAQRLGARKKKEAGLIGTQAIVLSLLGSVLVVIVGLLLLEPLFGLMGATGNVLELCMLYFLPILFCTPFLFLSQVFASVLNGEGDMKMPAIIRGASVFLNLGMDYLFIFVFGWGIFGAGLATALSIVVEVLAFAYYLFVYQGGQIRFFKKWKYDSRLTWDILKIGIPTSAAQFLMAFSWFFFNGLFARFGTEAVAAYGIVTRVGSIAFMPLFGLTIGLVTLVGMFYGAKKYDLIVRTIKASLRYGLLYAVPLGALFWIFPTLVLRVLTNDLSVIAIAVTLIRIEVFEYPIMVFSFFLGRAMIGLGDGKPTLIITSIRLLLVAVPLGWLFVSLGYGPSSLIMAMLLAGVVASVIAVFWIKAKLQKIKAECTSS